MIQTVLTVPSLCCEPPRGSSPSVSVFRASTVVLVGERWSVTVEQLSPPPSSNLHVLIPGVLIVPPNSHAC